MKFTVTVTDFRPFHRNTLRGFATVRVDELHLTLHEVAVHQHDIGARWVGLPAKPVVGQQRQRQAYHRRQARICAAVYIRCSRRQRCILRGGDCRASRLRSEGF